MTELDAAQRELNALADELVRRGMSEGTDFFIQGHRDKVTVSSEYVALLRDPGRFLATYNDMGQETVLADTADLDEARAAFVRAVVNLGQGRGTQITEQDFGL